MKACGFRMRKNRMGQLDSGENKCVECGKTAIYFVFLACRMEIRLLIQQHVINVSAEEIGRGSRGVPG